ncbi:MAG: serine/threonine protein kinase, partial [Gemmatimonadota bacterium]|nr:serine/threonine protein kinase [Gemmatimonadota bacterium]
MTNPYRVTWDRWDEVDALFDRALDLPAEGREAFLQGICGDDPPLLEAVLELLAKDGPSAAERLAQPSRTLIRAAVDSGSEAGSQGLGPGDLVGRYRVVTELGRGGMATVYEAERADGAFDRLVALKVLRRGLDTEALVRRFLSERQILSGLTHPNIATLLDGGATEDGRPYLVMELVRGSPITEWADHHSLGTRERVESFLQVVDAVAFAHAQLIVHRDLKPSNVLVTAEGMATLLDFGVAKLLDVADEGEEALTRVAPAPMTPEYASPEQIQGGRVTAASDVFQLGALLYRLLTGVRPFEDPAARLRGVGLERAVRRPSESAPGDRARSLRGDLDTIILKALRPEPESRYGSVHALGADLRRYLAGHPISA